MSFTEIAIPKTLEDYVESKNKALMMIQQAHNLLEAAEAEMATIGNYCYPLDARMRDTPARIKIEMNKRLWEVAIDKTGFKQLMDAEAMRDFKNSVEREPPDFTIENIRCQFLTMYQDAGSMFNRGLVNVFKKLDSSYRTNEKEAFKVGKKIVIRQMFSNWLGTLSVNYGRYSSGDGIINDLDRVFKVLAGDKHDPRGLEYAINAHFKKGVYVYEDSYYRIKGFKNGNAHIEFKRDDLLEKANDIIADYYGGTIPDARNA